MHPASAPTDPQRYLLVDDHPGFRQVLRAFLPDGAVEVTECGSGAEAVRAYAESAPHWVCMDIEMPGLDGLSATRAILSQFPEARIVIVSQHDDPDLQLEARRAGAHAFVGKDRLSALRLILDPVESNRRTLPAPSPAGPETATSSSLSHLSRAFGGGLLRSVHAAALLWLGSLSASAVPLEIHYQGMVSVDGRPFTGTGQFKFALRDGPAAGATTLWTHDGSNLAAGEPASVIGLDVRRGVYSVALGDPAVPNMTAIPASVFSSDSLFLRVWFDDGLNGLALLSPDRPIRSVAFAVRAAIAETAGTVQSLPEGLIEDRHLPTTLLDRIATLESAVATLSEGLVPDFLTAVSTDPDDPALTSAGYEAFTTLPAPSWRAGSVAGQPSARREHAALWNGAVLLVWGGRIGSSAYLQTGALYDPVADAWSPVSPLDAPQARGRPSVVWTGDQFIVWGGFGATGGHLQTGGRYDPVTRQWTPVSTAGAPAGRQGQVAVWTGTRMLVWGGGNSGGLLNDGALYDPVLDQWTSLGVAAPPSARTDATAVWTGDRLLIWGGQGPAGPLDDGAQLTFSGGAPGAWLPLNATGAPSARAGHTLLWMGGQAMVFGGQFNGALLGDGATYDPATDTWTPLPTVDGPSARSGHVAVWTGSEALILGGAASAGDTATGHAFRPSTGWRSLSSDGNPLPRSQAYAAWDGREVLVFGGQSNGRNVASLQRLVPQPTYFLYRKP